MSEQEGWAIPLGARIYHYMVDHWSLCRKWGGWGSKIRPIDDNAPGNCVACRGLLERRRLQKEMRHVTGVGDE